MSRLIFASLFTEGATDVKFLESVVKKTLDEVAFYCKGDKETELKVINIRKSGLDFVEQVLEASKKGLEEYGIMILCVHADADNYNPENTYKYKIKPAQEALFEKDDKEYCKILVAVVPIQEMEAWMLADKELLKRQLNTDKPDFELGIGQNPEEITQPKERIEEAIRITRQNLPKRRRRDLTISDLYLPIGQELEIDKLSQLPSFQKFRESLEDAFRMLNLLA
ncbi:MAG: DUF4276 family protein [Microscillaceae bacterium]|nr:DUF4276 family protein [Microscillaceae bacterium]